MKLEPHAPVSPLLFGSRSPWLMPPRTLLERFLPPALAATVVCSAMGSSIEPHLNSLGHPARWLGLLAVAAASSSLVIRARLLAPPTVRETLVFSFGLLAFLSTLWSLWPRTSFAHAGAFAVVVIGATAVGRLYRGRRTIAAPVVGLAFGAGVVAVGGLVLTFIHPLDAFQLGPLRYRGLGQNPNTVPLLAALVVPLMACLYITARSRNRRRLALAGLFILVQSIFLSAARGSILAATLAVVVLVSFAPRPRRWRLKAFALLTLVLLYGLFSGSVIASVVHFREPVRHIRLARHTRHTVTGPPVKQASRGSTSACSGRAPSVAKSAILPGSGRQAAFPSISIGAPRAAGVVALLVPRLNTFFTGSGRLAAWQAAIRLGKRRPIVGYGFGTEDLVFCKASHELLSVFEGAFVENSYIGIFLQLGLAGVVLFLVLMLVVIAKGVAVVRRSTGDRRAWNAALVAVLLAGLVQAVFQSYVYSPGNIATLTLFVSLALLANQGTSSAISWPGASLFGRPLRFRARLSRVLCNDLVTTGRASKG